MSTGVRNAGSSCEVVGMERWMVEVGRFLKYNLIAWTPLNIVYVRVKQRRARKVVLSTRVIYEVE